MNAMRRSTGLGMTIVASAGLVLCLAMIVGVWITKRHVDAVGDKVFEAAEDALAFVDKKLDRVETAFRNVHGRIGVLSKAVDRFPRKEAGADSETTSLLKTLDEEVFEPLKSAQTWLDSTHAVAVGVGKVSEAVVSSKYAASHEDSVGLAIAERLQDVSESVVEILTTLKDARQGLLDLRDNVLSARRIVVAVVAHLTQAETGITNLCERTERLHVGVVEMKEGIADVRASFQWWTMLVAVLLTLLLAWFAVSQIGMMVHGWSLGQR
jgi:hypothetical protein